ncbi:MAG: hypothetical protein ACREOP_01585 [Thermodesulfobacteriota bacterium]
MSEFQTPQEQQGSGFRNGSSFKPLDQTLITAVTIILMALLSWIAYTSHSNSVGIAELNIKFDSSKVTSADRLDGLDERLDKLQTNYDELLKQKIK